MAEIFTVRSQKCEGCLYSPNAVVGLEAAKKHRRELRRLFAFNRAFACHCHSESTVVCRGWYDTFKSRIATAGRVLSGDLKFRFTKKKGAAWEMFRKLKPGDGTLAPSREDSL